MRLGDPIFDKEGALLDKSVDRDLAAQLDFILRLTLRQLPTLRVPQIPGTFIAMSSIKCANCHLVNFSHAEQCKRCGVPLNAVSGGADGSTKPLVGAWRDRRWLVKQLSVPLAQRCIKCSESADVTYHPVSVKVCSAWSLLTQLAGVRIYHVIPVDVPLCRRHRSGLDKIANGIMLAGIGGCVLGFAMMRMSSILPVVVFVSGFLLIGTGFVVYLVGRQFVRAWKYKDPYVWLWGVHLSYLEGLPDWSERHAR